MPRIKPRLIDFANPDGAPGVLHQRHLRLGDLSISRTVLSAHGGSPLGSEQTTVVVHRGAPIDLEWQDPVGDRRHSARVDRGLAHVNIGRRPLWQRWVELADILVIALDNEILARVAGEGITPTVDIRTSIAADDRAIRNFGELYEAELVNGGLGGRLYLDSLNTALASHLLRRYGAQVRNIPHAKGGLSPARLRSVIEYMHGHLNDSVRLSHLAATAGLTPHHFASAFKATLGEPPHRHLLRLRVKRARELLMRTPTPIAEIAAEVGFANQSQLTHHFRRFLGVTPARLRRKL